MTAGAAVEVPTVPGTPFAGGFFVGLFKHEGDTFALVVSPKAQGEHKDAIWIEDYKDVPGAGSYIDGLTNTQAMADAGSDLAKWALGLDIGGHQDWYLPSQDELEIVYRNLKPTTRENYCWARSGINLSADAPTRPYTPDSPVQTSAPAFQEGGTEAMTPAWYWSSTQHAADSDYAWYQVFYYGYQDYNAKDTKLRARAVRRLKI